MKKLFLLLPLLFLPGCITPNFQSQTPTNNWPAISTAGKAKTAVQNVVQKQSVFLYVAGFICLLVGGFLIYSQQILAGVKLVLAGFCLPILAAIWSTYYAWIVAGILIAGAILVFLHNKNFFEALFSKLKTYAAKSNGTK